MAKKKSSRSEQEKRKANWLAPYHFKPGNRANPGGRPKKKILTDSYKEQLEVLAPTEVAESIGLPHTATMADVVARRMAIRAVGSNKAVEAAREMREAIEGRAAQAVELKHGGEVTINVNFGRRKAHERAS